MRNRDKAHHKEEEKPEYDEIFEFNQRRELGQHTASCWIVVFGRFNGVYKYEAQETSWVNLLTGNTRS